MKKILTLVGAVILHASSFGQTEKKSSIGLGLATDLGVIGPDLHFSYDLKEKWALNAEAFYLFDMVKDPYVMEFDNGNRKYNLKSSDNNNSKFGFNVQVRRFFIGNSNVDTKFSLYGGLGLGFLQDKLKYTNEIDLPSTDSLYYYYDSEYKYNTVATTLTLGTDLKIGPGKVFFEIPVYYELYYNNKYKLSNSKGSLTGVDYSYSYSGMSFKHADVYLLINLGYKIKF